MEAMTRIEIVNEVHANIEFFREKWGAFCQWVEVCAEQLDGYQRRETERCDAISQKRRDVSRKWQLARARDDQAERWKWVVVCREVNREHKVEMRKLNRRLRYLQAREWAKWIVFVPAPRVGYMTDDLTLCNHWDFYAPPKIVNPLLWVFGWSNPREPNKDYEKEQLLVDCALLVVAHDAKVASAKRIYFPRVYQGTRFDCDGFCRKLTTGLDGMDRDGHLQRAWHDIRQYAMAYSNACQEGEMLVNTCRQGTQKADEKPSGLEQPLDIPGLVKRLKSLMSALDSGDKDHIARVRDDLRVYVGSAERLHDALQEPFRGGTAEAIERLRWVGDAIKSRTNTGLYAASLDALATPEFIGELERWLGGQSGMPTDDQQGEAYNAFQEGSGFWMITFQGKKLPPIQGREAFAYLAYILTHPKEWISAMGVMEAVHEAGSAQRREPSEIAEQSVVEEEETPSWRKGVTRQDTENKADRTYLKQCHEKLSGLRAEQQRAKDSDDEASADMCQQEIDAILDTLKGLTGPGGRFQKFANEVDDAYYAIRKATGRVMRKVAGYSPELLQHLDNCIHFDKPCISYRPETHAEWHWAKPQKEKT